MYYDRPITKHPPPRSGRLDALPADEPYPGVTRRTLDAERATVTMYAFAAGARFPLHRHPQEQVTIVQLGAVEMTIGGNSHALAAGAWSVVPPDVAHGVTAGPDGAEVLAVIVPPRMHADAYSLAGADGAE